MGNGCLQGTSKYSNITKRESDILRLIAEGCKSSEIANKLNLSVRTVETHRFNLIKKLKLNCAAQLVISAVEYIKTVQQVPSP